MALLPAALLSALVAVLALQSDGALVLDARVVGLCAAAFAIWLRAPILIVVILAGAVTAGLRAAGIG